MNATNMLRNQAIELVIRRVEDHKDKIETGEQGVGEQNVFVWRLLDHVLKTYGKNPSMVVYPFVVNVHDHRLD